MIVHQPAEKTSSDGVEKSARGRTVIDRFRLDGKVAIVTGASSGLGSSFAVALAEAGADLVIGARRADGLRECSDRIAATGRRAITVPCDVRQPESCADLIDAAVHGYGSVDILVNNAGVGAAVPALREEPSHYRWLIETNLEGPYWCAQHFARVAKPGSTIINIASSLGLRPIAVPHAGYVASKAGLIGLTRDLALQWTHRRGIRVNALAPGYFPSEMTDDIPQENRSMIESATLFRRFGRVDELTPALVYLASDASSYVSGTTLVVDGGLSLH
jgi:NAD(P)-dependent dehydrogenase (short-subunit alcohol dehydrogenase family)